MKIARLVASVKLAPIYSCGVCKRNEIGDTITLNFEGVSADALAEHVKAHRATSRHMPVGWSYNGEFQCSHCLSLRGKEK